MSFIKASDAIRDVVIKLDERRNAHKAKTREVMMDGVTGRMFQDSVRALEDQEMRDWEVKRGKELLTRALHKIRDNSSPEEAIKFLEDTLAAVKG